MKVFKKINNNVAFCYDASGHELIAFGKGIGFPKMPYELSDLSKIDRTYYDVDMGYLELLSEIDDQIFDLCAKIVDVARTKIKVTLCENLIFTLADHINFAIERVNKGMKIKNPLHCDIEYMYPDEMEVGHYAVKLIQKELGVALPACEASSIAIHLMNSEECGESNNTYENETVIEEVTQMIEHDHELQINRKNFNYSRFVSHMQYLLKRKEVNEQIISDNKHLYETMCHDYPKTYDCANKISEYLNDKIHWQPSEEELLYLMLHINRLCTREDCNQ